MGFFDSVGKYGGQIVKGIGKNIPGIGEIIRQEDQDKYARDAMGNINELGNISEEAAKALEALANGLDPSLLTPEEFTAVQEMHPEIAQYIQEQNPQLMTNGGQGRDLMVEQANAARAMAVNGDSPAMRAQRQLASMDASALQSNLLNQVQTQARQENRGGGGTDLMLSLGAGKQAQDAMYKSSLANQANSDNVRMQALQMMGSAGQGIQANDQQAQMANMNTMNDFNKRLAQNKWDYEKNKADTNNAAQQYNITNKQNAANNNVNARNNAKTNFVNTKTDLQKAAINARAGGKTDVVQGKNTIMGNQAGFNEGAGTRTANDTASAANLITTAIDAYSKYKGSK